MCNPGVQRSHNHADKPRVCAASGHYPRLSCSATATAVPTSAAQRTSQKLYNRQQLLQMADQDLVKVATATAVVNPTAGEVMETATHGLQAYSYGSNC